MGKINKTQDSLLYHRLNVTETCSRVKKHEWDYFSYPTDRTSHALKENTYMYIIIYIYIYIHTNTYIYIYHKIRESSIYMYVLLYTRTNEQMLNTMQKIFMSKSRWYIIHIDIYLI